MTEQITNIPDKEIKKNSHCRRRICGLKIARKLKRQHYQVVLWIKTTTIFFQPLLYH